MCPPEQLTVHSADNEAQQDRDAIYTIGHGNRTLDEFTSLLGRAGIGCLVDVRAFPGSRRHPHFGRAELARSLPQAGVDYMWEGADLGGRRRPQPGSPHLALRNASFRAYADHMQTETFAQAVERVIERASSTRVAIMCAERLPWQCHRYMIADYLTARGIEVLHLVDGTAPRLHTLRREARIRGPHLIYDRDHQAELGLS